MKKFNLEEFINFIVLLGFATLFWYLLTTGKINNFIHPKMIKYMIFSFVLFTILAIYQGNKIFIPKYKKPISKSYFLLVTTLIIGFLAAEKGLTLDIATNKGVNLGTYIKSDKIKPPSAKNNEESIKGESRNNIEESENNFINDQDTITINENNFYNAVNEMGGNSNKYIGKKIIISGFVFRKEGFKENEFVTARMLMACCAADSQVIGIMGRYDKAMNLEKDSWIQVEGIIETTEYKDESSNNSVVLPIINVVKVENITPPSNIYVYP